MPIGQDEDSEISFDIELPERLRKKREKAKIQNYDNDGKTDGDDVLIGAAIIGLTAVIPLDDQDLDNMRDNQDDNNTIRVVAQDVEVEVEEPGQSKFGHVMAKMKYMGAEGLVFAGILEPGDLPPNPDEEEKDEDEEGKVEEEEEDEDEDSNSDEDDEDEDGDGGGKKKKKKGAVEEEEEEELADDY